MRFRKRWLTAVVLTGTFVLGQTWTVDSIREKLEIQTRKIHDYSATVSVSVSMPMFRMPRKKIHVYFRAGTDSTKDQFKLKTRGFAVVPKTGLSLDVARLFDNFTNFDPPQEVDSPDGKQILLTGTVAPDSLQINIGDDSEEKPVIKQELWIDPERWVVLKSVILLDTAQVMTLQTEYDEVEDHIFMPKQTEVTFKIGSRMLQQLNREHMGPGPSDNQMKLDTSKDFAGQVVMEFKKYKINKGIPDKVFESEDE